MKNLYCGGWSFQNPTSGVCAFALRGGKWERLGVYGTEIPAQSILAIGGDTLLAVSERRDGGAVVRYRLGENGEPAVIGKLDFDTPLMSYVSLSPDGRYAFTSSMGSPRVKMIRLENDGSMRLADEWLLTGHSVTDRQRSAKSHSVQVSPDGRLLAVANFGADELELFAIDRERERLRLLQSVAVDFGRQPRHMVFHPCGGWLYLLTESGNRVYVYRLQNDTLTELAAYSTQDPDKKATGMAADIAIRPDGAFLYASNRGQNNVTVWRVLPSGLLDTVGYFDCGGAGPRGIAVNGDGSTLLCANNDSGTVTVLPLDRDTGVPGKPVQTLDMPAAACVRVI